MGPNEPADAVVYGLNGGPIFFSFNETDIRLYQSAGFVTTARVTHATPGALYAHSNSRNWECDTEIPENQRDCAKDIGRQLVEDSPGTNFKVSAVNFGSSGEPSLKFQPVTSKSNFYLNNFRPSAVRSYLLDIT